MVYPNEATAMAWNTLTQLTAYLQVSVGVVQALENKFGSFSDRIGSISAIPEQVGGMASGWRISL